MPIKTLLNGDPHLSAEENEQMFSGVQTFIARSGRFTQGRWYHITAFISTNDKRPLLDPRLGVGIGMGFLGTGARVQRYRRDFILLFRLFLEKKIKTLLWHMTFMTHRNILIRKIFT